MEKSFEAKRDERVKGELETFDMENLYRENLDETEQCAFCKQFGGAARIIEELDPTMYSCGLNDFADSMSDRYIEIDGDYYDRSEVEDIEEEIRDEEERDNEADEEKERHEGGVK